MRVDESLYCRSLTVSRLLRLGSADKKQQQQNKKKLVVCTDDPIMRVRLAPRPSLTVLLLQWFLNLQPLCVAAETPQTTGFTVEYALIIANSPDCSLIDNFPVRVQYRVVITGGDGGQNNSINQWIGSPNIPGIYIIIIHVLSVTC
jgi:hypothetical protein